jgi:hypothetical protein
VDKLILQDRVNRTTKILTCGKKKTNILRKTATELRKIIVLAWPGIAYYMLTQKGYVQPFAGLDNTRWKKSLGQPIEKRRRSRVAHSRHLA